ncbi:MAG: hypothetical protein J6U54_07820 [Clostridiales bacterium]|nr:hypothetical protein [Clostridiales bacterium]
MKKETISEAMKNISEEYVLEALELHNREVVSDNDIMKASNIKKKVLIVAIAAVVAGAVGITAFAALRGINSETPEPSETITQKVKSYVPEDDSEETTEVSPSEVQEKSVIAQQTNIASYDGEAITYTNMSKTLTFNGPEECQAIRIKLTSIPEGYHFLVGRIDEWAPDNAIQATLVETDENGNEIEHVFNITVNYSSQFGPDGSMMFFDDFDTESDEQDGNIFIHKMSGMSSSSGDYPLGVAYTVMFCQPEGYIVTIAAETPELCDQLQNALVIEERGFTAYAEYDPESPNWYMCNGIG